MIDLRGVSVERDGKPILAEVTAQLAERRIAVIGANGSGKSTFARLLNGLVEPTAGTVTIDGFDPSRQARQVRARVGFVFTNPDAQIVMPTVGEDVAFSLRGKGLTRSEINARTSEVLHEYGLADLADRPAHDLSGGQKQLLALCSVLVARPSILVADEPTTLLDARNTRLVADILMDLPQQLVVVTHDLALAARCDVALLFDGGRLLQLGDPAAAIERYERELVG
jgi:biotin transport system ATP-binding protein